MNKRSHANSINVDNLKSLGVYSLSCEYSSIKLLYILYKLQNATEKVVFRTNVIISAKLSQKSSDVILADLMLVFFLHY